MKCPHLQGEYLQSCKASKAVYVPSQFEFDEYCTQSIHTMCPFYSKAFFAASFPPREAGAEKMYSGVK